VRNLTIGKETLPRTSNPTIMTVFAGRLAMAVKAEELRGKLRRFYVDQAEHGAAHEFEQMSNDELRRWIAAETRALSLEAGPPELTGLANGVGDKKR
jgi:hypothetical protein